MKFQYKPKYFKNKFTNTRKGEIKNYEFEYIQMLCFLFKTGCFNIPHNYPMRIFLAHCLGCKPMRISKFKTGTNAVNKQRYRLKTNQSSDEIKNSFLKIQMEFFKKVNIKNTILIPTIFDKNNNYDFDYKIDNNELPKLKIKLLKKPPKKEIKLYSDIEDNLEKITFLDPYVFLDYSDFVTI
jgi:hypothetical protein